MQEAIAEFGRLLEDQARVLSADHPATLRTRGNLASWLGRAGQVPEAAAEFGSLTSAAGHRPVG